MESELYILQANLRFVVNKVKPKVNPIKDHRPWSQPRWEAVLTPRGPRQEREFCEHTDLCYKLQSQPHDLAAVRAGGCGPLCEVQEVTQPHRAVRRK